MFGSSSTIKTFATAAPAPLFPAGLYPVVDRPRLIPLLDRASVPPTGGRPPPPPPGLPPAAPRRPRRARGSAPAPGGRPRPGPADHRTRAPPVSVRRPPGGADRASPGNSPTFQTHYPDTLTRRLRAPCERLKSRRRAPAKGERHRVCRPTLLHSRWHNGRERTPEKG